MARTWLVLSALGAALTAVDAGETMRAVVATARAKSESDFSTVEVRTNWPKPHPKKGEVLIKVAASAINPVDWKLLSGSEMSDLTKLGPKVLGFDVSGVVEEVGSGCDRLKVGDAVWADLGLGKIDTTSEALAQLPAQLQLGAWAEYAVAKESQVGLKPSTLSFEEAASLPLVSLTDLQAFEKVALPAGTSNISTAVVTSGSGGTGVVALQLLKAFNVSRIITASSPKNFDLLKSLGATDVVDYHKGTIWDTLSENSVDFVFDNFDAPGTADLAMKSIRPGGTFLYVPGKGGGAAKHPKEGVRQINFGLCDSSRHQDLDRLKVLAEAGKLRAVIGQSFSLEDIKSALNVSEHGHAIGKLGVNVSSLARMFEQVLV